MLFLKLLDNPKLLNHAYKTHQFYIKNRLNILSKQIIKNKTQKIKTFPNSTQVIKPIAI